MRFERMMQSIFIIDEGWEIDAAWQNIFLIKEIVDCLTSNRGVLLKKLIKGASKNLVLTL